MTNKILMLSSLLGLVFIFVSCDKTNPSGTLKRWLKANGGEWEVTQVDDYYTGLHYPEYESSKDLGVMGVFFFDDEGEPRIAGDFGTWTPVDGEKKDIIYQVADTQGNLTVATWVWENDETTDHNGYGVVDGWTKTEVVWGNSTTVADTIIRHIKTLRKLGE
ncbi:MAG: hypothetical protein GQ574_07930 [Crocinitomix sp.]|nr:hypothetical protein [Crocinitomix sp.]